MTGILEAPGETNQQLTDKLLEMFSDSGTNNHSGTNIKNGDIICVCHRCSEGRGLRPYLL